MADETAAVRTLLDLVAELMEESFAVMGEGHILGTMPAYLERFGGGNARYVAKKFLAADTVRGPRSALSAMDVVSTVTGTPYEVERTPAGVVKRLGECEFLPAFRERGPFPRAMMCMLHCAAYQGSVNGLVPSEQGFDVQVTRRILFGDDHCDFLVQPRSEPDPEDAPIAARQLPGPADRRRLAYHFYTFLLTSFVDYLSHHLDEETVAQMLRRVAARVGTRAAAAMAEAGIASGDARQVGQAIMLLAGRELGEGLHVRACPQATFIRSTATGANEEDRQRVRRNACRLCKNLLAGAIRETDPGADVEWSTSLALGDAFCDFEVVRHA